MMHLPMPNADELDRFINQYEGRFGFRPERGEAYDALCRLVHLIYLTEYHRLRPLGTDDPAMLLSPSQYRKWKEDLGRTAYRPSKG